MAGASAKDDVIVDELLCFIQNKIDVLPTESIIHLCGNFTNVEIEASKKQIVELLGLSKDNGNSKRTVKRQGPEKSKRNLEDIIKLVLESDDDLPRFVALDLSKLPPVSFDSIDVSCLLSNVTKVQTQVSFLMECIDRQNSAIDANRCTLGILDSDFQELKKSVSSLGKEKENENGKIETKEVLIPPSPMHQKSSQTPNKNTATVGAIIDHTVTESTSSDDPVHQPSAEREVEPKCVIDCHIACMRDQMKAEANPSEKQSLVHETVGSVTRACSSSSKRKLSAKEQRTSSPTFAEVVSSSGTRAMSSNAQDAGPTQHSENSWNTMSRVNGKLHAVPSHMGPIQPYPKQDLGKGAGLSKSNDDNRSQMTSVSPTVMGSVKDSGLVTVSSVRRPRAANLFVSRFHPSVDKDMLATYIKNKVGLDAVVTPLNTKYDTYKSFFVRVICDTPSMFMNDAIWPEGAYVRWWKQKEPYSVNGTL